MLSLLAIRLSETLILFINIITRIYLHVCTHACHGARVDVRGQLSGVDSRDWTWVISLSSKSFTHWAISSIHQTLDVSEESQEFLLLIRLIRTLALFLAIINFNVHILFQILIYNYIVYLYNNYIINYYILYYIYLLYYYVILYCIMLYYIIYYIIY